MTTLLRTLETFFQERTPVIIVNTSTDQALLCLKPEFEVHDDMILMKFDSKNDRDGNSVWVKAIQGCTKETLYIENECENVLMLQKLNLANYRHYIQPQYASAPHIASEEELRSCIRSFNEE